MSKIKAQFYWDGCSYPTTMEVDTSQKVFDYFTVGELANTSAKDDIKYVSTPRHRKFVRMVEVYIRPIWGGIIPNSCYRTESFNKSCGGDPVSRHLYGEAMDIARGKVTLNAAMYNKIANAWEHACIMEREVGAINFYSGGIHLEIGTDKSYGNSTFQRRDYRGKKGDW